MNTLQKYWLSRHVSLDMISTLKLGETTINGINWLTIPIFDYQGETLYEKLRRPPNGLEHQMKSKLPKGATAQMYPRPYLHKGVKRIFICEGEPDVMVLLSYGQEAICSTAGAGCFKEEWLDEFPEGIEIVLCLDTDEAGKKGQEKISEMFREKRPDIRIKELDLTDYFKNHPGNDITDFFSSLFPNA